jgi:hypothetical protein
MTSIKSIIKAFAQGLNEKKEEKQVETKEINVPEWIKQDTRTVTK